METEHWEKSYQDGNMPWDHGRPSAPLLDEIAVRPISGRVLVIGCGRGHDVAALAERGIDVVGLDVAPTAVALAKMTYPQWADRFVEGNLFHLPDGLRGAFDVVIEHTCLSGLPPALRPQYAMGIRSALKPEGLVVGVWYINPDLDPGECGPPFPLPVEELDAMFREDFVIETDYVPDSSFEGRKQRERIRVLRRRRPTQALI